MRQRSDVDRDDDDDGHEILYQVRSCPLCVSVQVGGGWRHYRRPLSEIFVKKPPDDEVWKSGGN